MVLALAEEGRREIAREEVIDRLGVSPGAADRVIRSLRRKGWLARASWGKYLLIPPEQGPDALGESNLLALASRVAAPYYLGYGTAAAHYGFSTQHRNVILEIEGATVRIVNPGSERFFGFGRVQALGYPVMMSDPEKTVVDCVDRPDLAGGHGEVAEIVARAARRLDWSKTADCLERIGEIALIRRFGWLAEHAGAAMTGEVRERLHELSAGGAVSVLGPRSALPDSIGYDPRWRLRVTLPLSELREAEGLGRRRTLKRETT